MREQTRFARGIACQHTNPYYPASPSSDPYIHKLSIHLYNTKISGGATTRAQQRQVRNTCMRRTLVPARMETVHGTPHLRQQGRGAALHIWATRAHHCMGPWNLGYMPERPERREAAFAWRAVPRAVRSVRSCIYGSVRGNGYLKRYQHRHCPTLQQLPSLLRSLPIRQGSSLCKF